MKLTTILKISAISLTTLISSCGDKHDDHADHDHGDHGDHAGHDHADGEEHDHPNEEQKDEHAGHDHGDPTQDHTNCSVVVGPTGGRMIDDHAELKLNDQGELTLAFTKAPAEGTQVMLLLNTEPLELTQEGNTYISTPIADKLPADVHVSIKNTDVKHVEVIKVESGECTKCNQTKLACTCNNHEHDHDDHGHDHGDHGHDH